MTPSGIEPAIFLLVAQCLKPNCGTVPPIVSNNCGVKENLIDVTFIKHRKHQVYLAVLLMAVCKSKRLLVKVILTMCCLGAPSSKYF